MDLRTTCKPCEIVISIMSTHFHNRPIDSAVDKRYWIYIRHWHIETKPDRPTKSVSINYNLQRRSKLIVSVANAETMLL